MEPRFIDRVSASAHILRKYGISRKPATLAKLAVIGGGPQMVKAGHKPMYTTEWLDQWVEETILSTPGKTTTEISENIHK